MGTVFQVDRSHRVLVSRRVSRQVSKAYWRRLKSGSLEEIVVAELDLVCKVSNLLRDVTTHHPVETS